MFAHRHHAHSSRACAALTCLLALGGCHQRAIRSSPRPSRAPTSSISEPELATRSAARAEDLLEGRFPGVHVRRTANGGLVVSIRGSGTLSPDRQPLYVVDGMPVEVSPSQGLTFVSPSDIARIVVLKDPAETTIYGSRGANGVVLITTKRSR